MCVWLGVIDHIIGMSFLSHDCDFLAAFGACLKFFLLFLRVLRGGNHPSRGSEYPCGGAEYVQLLPRYQGHPETLLP